MMRAAWSVLLVETREPLRQRLAAELRPRFDVWCVPGVERAVELLAERPFDVVVTGLMLGDGDGLTVLVAAASMWPGSARVLVGEGLSADALAQAHREGLVHHALPDAWPAGALREAVARLALRLASARLDAPHAAGGPSAPP